MADGQTRSQVDERGSTLLLFPTGVLVVLVLSAITVDLSLIHASQRRVERVVAAAADDAATAIDLDRLHLDGEIAVDPSAARSLVERRIRDGLDGVDGVDVRSIEVTTIGDRSVEVAVRARVRGVFAPAIPGGGRPHDVEVRRRAELVGG